MSSELLRAVTFSFLQATASSFFSVILALLCLPFFLSLNKTRTLARALLLLPQMISPVLVVLGLLLSFEAFPFGFWGLCLGHVFINFGIAVIIFGESGQVILTEWSGLNLFLGGTNFFFLKKVFLPLILPQLLRVFGVIFIFCLGSLYIPLSLGGSFGAKTLEVLLYEKIKISGDINGAVGVGILQMALNILAVVGLHKIQGASMIAKKHGVRIDIKTETPSFYNRARFFIFWLVTFLMLIPIFKIASLATVKLIDMRDLLQSTDFITSLLNSTFVALCVMLLIGVGILMWNIKGSNSLLTFFPMWSGLLVGLSGYLIFTEAIFKGSWGFLIVLIMCQFIVFYFPILRAVSHPLREMYKKFNSVFTLYPGRTYFLAKKVFLPLNRKYYLLAGLLSFCWSAGDFSVAAILAPSSLTLPLFIQSLLGQYRLEMAAVASLVLLVFGGVGALLAERLHYGQD